MNRLGEEYFLKGENNPTKIAKATGIPRKDVVIYQEEWRMIMANDKDLHARARETVMELDKQYDQLIREGWIAYEEAASARDKATILKTIGEFIAKRQEVLQKAGLYDDAAMGDELARTEEQMDKIKELLKSVASKHPEVRREIMEGLSQIFDEAVGVPDTSPGGATPVA